TVPARTPMTISEGKRRGRAPVALRRCDASDADSAHFRRRSLSGKGQRHAARISLEAKPALDRPADGTCTFPRARAGIAITHDRAHVTCVTMPGRPKDPRHFRLASGRQLWRLNTFGRLRVADDAAPITRPMEKTNPGRVRCP